MIRNFMDECWKMNVIDTHRTAKTSWQAVFFSKATLSPCLPEKLSNFREAVQNKLGKELPDDYLFFLGCLNGYNDGERMIYGTTSLFQKATYRLIYGLLEMNIEYFHYLCDGLVIGECGHDLLTFDARQTKPYAIESRYGYAKARYHTLDDLLNAIVMKKEEKHMLRQPANSCFEEGR